MESNASNDGLSLADEETATDANIPFPKMVSPSPVTSIALKLKSLSDEELVRLGAQLSNQATKLVTRRPDNLDQDWFCDQY